jgi:hypothetical protein
VRYNGSRRWLKPQVCLSAKYNPAMRQIANDFRAMEDEADRAGTVANQKLKGGISAGFENAKKEIESSR